jgi:hypothetical protein
VIDIAPLNQNIKVFLPAQAKKVKPISVATKLTIPIRKVTEVLVILKPLNNILE